MTIFIDLDFPENIKPEKVLEMVMTAVKHLPSVNVWSVGFGVRHK